ncbi:SIT4 phosphatase-associated protein-domain-containing protein [Blastocladiella britannica]|nr:SIT4 phosphatase-associated protein-domain-containing protein [Blastocladiella britannica]
MFWRLGVQAASMIDAVLDSPTVTIEEVLDQSDLLQEIKSANPKLITYLTRPEAVTQLIGYVTKLHLVALPSDTDEQQQQQQQNGGVVGPDSPTTPRAAAPPTTTTGGSVTDSATTLPNSSSSSSSASIGSTGSGSKDAAGNRKSTGSGDTSPVEEAERQEKLRVRYPYIVSEIYSADVLDFLDSLIESPSSIQDLLQVLDLPVPLDAHQAAYWSKILSNLLVRKTEPTLQALKAESGFLPRLVAHAIENANVMDLLLKLVGVEELPAGRLEGSAQWLRDQGLVDMLIGYMDPNAHAPDTHATASSALLDMVAMVQAICVDGARMEENPLVAELKSERVVGELVKWMLDVQAPHSASTLVSGVALFVELIRRNSADMSAMFQSQAAAVAQMQENSNVGGEGSPLRPGSADAIDRRVPMNLCSMVRVLCAHLPELQQVLVNNQFGTRDLPVLDPAVPGGARRIPLGQARLRLCELLAELLRCAIEEAIMDPTDEPAETQRMLVRAATAAAAPTPLHASSSIAGGGNSLRPITDMQVASSAEMFTAAQSPPPQAAGAAAGAATGVPPPRTTSIGIVVPVSTTSTTITTTDDNSVHDNVSELADQVTSSLALNPSGYEGSNAGDGTGVVAGSASGGSLAAAVGTIGRSPSDTAQTTVQFEADLPLVGGRVGGGGTVSFNEVVTSGEAASEQRASSRRVPASIRLADLAPIYGEELQAALRAAFTDTRILVTCLDLFFYFPWNNILHGIVYDMVLQVLNGASDRTASLVRTLLRDGALLRRIPRASRASDYEAEQPKGVRLGYMGHVTLIADVVVAYLEQRCDDGMRRELADQLAAEDWLEYAGRTLRETRDRESKVLGGARPNAGPNGLASPTPYSYGLDDGDDDGDVMDVAGGVATDQFARYLCQQISGELPDRFGVIEDDDDGDDMDWAGPMGYQSPSERTGQASIPSSSTKTSITSGAYDGTDSPTSPARIPSPVAERPSPLDDVAADIGPGWVADFTQLEQAAAAVLERGGSP